MLLIFSPKLPRASLVGTKCCVVPTLADAPSPWPGLSDSLGMLVPPQPSERCSGRSNEGPNQH
jgi:hypothetical protein